MANFGPKRVGSTTTWSAASTLTRVAPQKEHIAVRDDGDSGNTRWGAVLDLEHALKQRIASWNAIQDSAAITGLRLHPRLHLRIAGLLQPAVGVGNGLAVKGVLDLADLCRWWRECS
jgi:hypothetical protein